MEFKTKGVIFKIKNDPITMKSWVKERDEYTRIQLFSKLLPSRQYIFVVEAKPIELDVGVKKNLAILVQCFSFLKFLFNHVMYFRSCE